MCFLAVALNKFNFSPSYWEKSVTVTKYPICLLKHPLVDFSGVCDSRISKQCLHECPLGSVLRRYITPLHYKGVRLDIYYYISLILIIPTKISDVF